MHGQWDWMRDPKIHSTTWEWDNASPAELWKHSHNELHHTYTNVLGRDNDLGYGIMRVDEDQPWHPFYIAQPLWNFINACFFEYGIAAYDLEVGKAMKGRKDPAELAGQAKKVLRKIRRQATRDYVVHPLLSGPSAAHHARRERHRQPRAQPLDALGDHVRPLPRGRRDLREDLDRRRDPRRVVPAPDARLGQHHRQPAHAPDDRQPLLPDRAPPLPRPAQQPLPGDRAQGRGALRALRPDLHQRPAAQAGRLGMEEGLPPRAAQPGHAQGRRNGRRTAHANPPRPPPPSRSPSQPEAGDAQSPSTTRRHLRGRAGVPDSCLGSPASC